MTQLFLNEPSIELAHKKYLESWSLPTVQASWKGRRPSLAQFRNRYAEAHAARQSFLSNVGTQVLDVEPDVIDERRMDDVQEMAEAVAEGVRQALANLTPPRFAEVSDDDLPPAPKPAAPQVRTETKAEDTGKTVKPQNLKKLPNTKQLYFLLHRAIEAGHSLAMVPLTRGDAAKAISLIKSGTPVSSAMVEIRKNL